MIDNFTTQLITTLITSLQAVTPEGAIDHKTRLAALKEARTLLSSLMAKMPQQERETLSTSIAQQFEKKLAVAQSQEERLNKLLPKKTDEPSDADS